MTDSSGRIDLILRSARKGRGKKYQPLLPFCLYELSWSGKGELKHLNFFEVLDGVVELAGKNLFCALYLNELVYRLLPQHVPDADLLAAYSVALHKLARAGEIESALREFELTLLGTLGYGLDLQFDVDGFALRQSEYYAFVPEAGLKKVEPKSLGGGSVFGVGRHFLAMAERDFSEMEVQRLAKQVLRTALKVHLGNRPLRSRQLFC